MSTLFIWLLYIFRIFSFSGSLYFLDDFQTGHIILSFWIHFLVDSFEIILSYKVFDLLVYFVFELI